MRRTNLLHPVLSNTAGKPSRPAALLFLSRINATLTSSWLDSGISMQSSSIGFATTSLKGVLAPSSPRSLLEKCFLYNLSTPSAQRLRLSCSLFLRLMNVEMLKLGATYGILYSVKRRGEIDHTIGGRVRKEAEFVLINMTAIIHIARC